MVAGVTPPHVTREQWERRQELEQDHFHICDHWHEQQCICHGECDCHHGGTVVSRLIKTQRELDALLKRIVYK